MNAVNDGVWCVKLRTIDRGPLVEDTEEYASFLTQVMGELDPGDSLLLRQAALDVADKMWRMCRAQRWEAWGHSSLENASDFNSHSDANMALVRELRAAAEAVHHPLEAPVDVLQFAVSQVSNADLYTDDVYDEVGSASVERLSEMLAEFAERDRGGLQAAAARFEARAHELERDTRGKIEADRPFAVRREVDSQVRIPKRRWTSNSSSSCRVGRTLLNQADAERTYLPPFEPFFS